MRILVTLLLFFLLTLNADETLTSLFSQLKTVPKSDKFKVVNEIKKHIIALKQQERVEAIKLLQVKKSMEQKKVEVENLNSSNNQMLQDCKMDKEMKQSEMPKMKNMPKNMNQMSNMQNMNSLNTMHNINNIQNLSVPQRERRANRENRREGMGRR